MLRYGTYQTRRMTPAELEEPTGASGTTERLCNLLRPPERQGTNQHDEIRLPWLGIDIWPILYCIGLQETIGTTPRSSKSRALEGDLEPCIHPQN